MGGSVMARLASGGTLWGIGNTAALDCSRPAARPIDGSGRPVDPIVMLPPWALKGRVAFVSKARAVLVWLPSGGLAAAQTEMAAGFWIPAFAGMTGRCGSDGRQEVVMV